MEGFKFSLMGHVVLKTTNETARVKGRAEYVTGRRQYQIQICGMALGGKPHPKLWIDEELLDTASGQQGPGVSEHENEGEENA